MEGFAADFTRPAEPETWAHRLSRWVSPELSNAYQQVPAYRIPTGQLRAVKPLTAGPYAVTFRATYGGGLTVQGLVEKTSAGYVVTYVEPTSR